MALPEEGARRTEFDVTWVWFKGVKAPDSHSFGRWSAAEGLAVQIHPPKPSSSVWLVTIPVGTEREIMVQLGDEETAFRYAASARNAKEN